MFKNMLKRSWLSTIRRPGRAVLIGLVLFAMANLVLASVAIKGAVAESMDYAKSTLGGTVYLQPDISKLRAQMQSQSATQTPGQPPKFDRPDIPVSQVKSMADSGYVKDYTYSLNAQAKASGFTPIEAQTNGMGGIRMFGQDETTTQLEGDITVQGINAYAFIDAVKNETMKLTDGKYFDETTNDSVLISYDLATSNSIKVGDTITMQNIYDSSSHEVKVIGIYDLTEEQAGPVSPENTVYMNTTTAAKFLSTDAYNNGDYNVQNVNFTLTNAEHADAFIAEAKDKFTNLESDNLTLSIDTSAYEQMVGPIESVGGFATTIFWIVIIASVAIVTLIVMINVKERRYEMGVLLSLGASKLNVASQIAVELLVVGTLAFAVSAGTGTLVAKAMGQGLLDSQQSMSETESDNNFGRPASFGGGRMVIGGPGMQQNSDVEAIDTIDVNASASDYALLFTVGYGVIILALLLPTWGIVKYQPKTILTGKE